MGIGQFDKNCLGGLGRNPNKRHMYYICTACALVKKCNFYYILVYIADGMSGIDMIK